MIAILMKLGIRNILRNHKRTFLTAGVVATGCFSLIFIDGFMKGVQKTMIDTQTSLFTGHLQVHHPDYKKNIFKSLHIKDKKKVLEKLDKTSQVLAFSERANLSGIISSSWNNLPTTIIGIEPDKEKKVSQVHKKISKGSFFNTKDENPIVLGKKICDFLKIKLGQKVMLTAQNQQTKETVQHTFRIVGIVESGYRMLDKQIALIDISQFRKLFAYPNTTNQITIKVNSAKEASATKKLLIKKTDSKNHFVEDWKDLLPSLNTMIKTNSYAVYIVFIILSLFVILAIINTMFMSIFERLFEFGILKAIGTKATELTSMILWESFFLSLLGSILGALLGFVLIILTRHYGLDYRDFEFEGYKLSEKLKPTLEFLPFIIFPIVTTITGTLAGLYPAIYAAKIKISYALGKHI
jgi:ABC-type lipoprotein release transport system permease subunit